MTDPEALRELKEQYDEWAPTYDRDACRWGYCTPWKVERRLTPHLKNGMNVVELACGTGLNGIRYQYLDLNLVGVDVSAKMLEKASKSCGYLAVQADMGRTPFKDSSFDASLCTTALEHFPDIRPYLLEMKRIVKPNGIIAFTVAHSQIRGLNRVPRKELVQILADCKIKEIEILKIFSHFDQGEDSIYFWSTIGNNTK